MDVFFGGNAPWFSVPAIIGTVFFLMRLVMMFVGGHGDVHGDLHADVGGHVGDHADHSDSAFKVLSVQSISAFMMGFGWGGLGGLMGAGWDATTSLVFGLVTGAGMVWILGKLLEGVYRLQSTGTVAIDAALGGEGTVYVAVPGRREGRGEVRLVISGRQRYLSAVTDDGTIESSAGVRVVEINDDNTVTVARI